MKEWWERITYRSEVSRLRGRDEDSERRPETGVRDRVGDGQSRGRERSDFSSLDPAKRYHSFGDDSTLAHRVEGREKKLRCLTIINRKRTLSVLVWHDCEMLGSEISSLLFQAKSTIRFRSERRFPGFILLLVVISCAEPHFPLLHSLCKSLLKRRSKFG